MINDREKRYGLLLESPEPIAWERTVVQLTYDKHQEPIMESLAAVKIITANQEELEDKRFLLTALSVLVLEDMDLTGSKIQISNSQKDSGVFRDCYHFDKFYTAGTTIAISLEKLSAFLAKAHLTYTRKESIVIRIVNPEGSEILYTTTLKPADPQIIESSIISNKDGTKAFVIPKDKFLKNELKNGSYLLSLTYYLELEGYSKLRKSSRILENKVEVTEENVELRFTLN
ncbi:MAG: hypothetical protein KDD15_23050 [Lewinella sp.]|nr:hypothetical protein [Lewinella sp.]